MCSRQTNLSAIGYMDNRTVASHLDRFAFREAPLTFDWREEG